MKRVNVLQHGISLLLLSVVFQAAHAEDWFDRESQWHGHQRLHFTIAERSAYVVQPKKAAAGHPWVWRARFPDFHYEADVELLKRGFHIGYVDVAGLFGSPTAMAIGDEFYKFMTAERGLNPKPVLEGCQPRWLVCL